MKVGVEFYFSCVIIIFLIYSLKCSALTNYSPTAGFFCRTEVGVVKRISRAERGWGAQKNMTFFAGG